MGRAPQVDGPAVVAVIGDAPDLAPQLADVIPDVLVLRVGSVRELLRRAAGAAVAAVLVGRPSRFAESLGVVKEVRAEPSLDAVPVLVFGSRSNPAEEADALFGGADDFVDRFAPGSVVAARVSALGRRKSQDARAAGPALPRQAPRPAEVVRVGGIALDPGSYVATVNGSRVVVTVGEFRLLWQLATNAGRVLTAAELVPAVAYSNHVPVEHAVRSRVFRLRKKLGAAAGQLRTVRHAGYVLVEHADDHPHDDDPAA